LYDLFNIYPYVSVSDKTTCTVIYFPSLPKKEKASVDKLSRNMQRKGKWKVSGSYSPPGKMTECRIYLQSLPREDQKCKLFENLFIRKKLCKCFNYLIILLLSADLTAWKSDSKCIQLVCQILVILKISRLYYNSLLLTNILVYQNSDTIIIK
jgi:hypothetical protein